jgi:sugar transferase EpsL
VSGRAWRKAIGRAAKRGLDVAAAALALAILAGPMLLVAASILVTMGRPVLFVQDRTGLGGRTFRLYKFRTMREPGPGLQESDDERLTRLGRLLRATSLDELPQLLNVLKGEMSLVGPRPLLPAYLSRYTADQMRRHEVRPGLTGWAQVKGRNELTWEERFALDVWYVDHRTFLLDLRILARTAAAVLRRRGVSHPGHATMPEFIGSARAASRREGPS